MDDDSRLAMIKHAKFINFVLNRRAEPLREELRELDRQIADNAAYIRKSEWEIEQKKLHHAQA